MHICSFGDSWPAGAELHPGEKPFAYVLADMNNCSATIHAQTSSSIHHIPKQIQTAIARDQFANSTAIFFLTGIDRETFFDETGKEVHTSVYATQEPSLMWYKHYHTHKLVEYRINTTLLAIQALCDKHSVDAYFMWGWDSVELWEENKQLRFYPTTAKEIFDPDPSITFIELKTSKNKYIWPNSGHPNQLGHEKIAEELDKFIKSC